MIFAVNFKRLRQHADFLKQRHGRAPIDWFAMQTSDGTMLNVILTDPLTHNQYVYRQMIDLNEGLPAEIKQYCSPIGEPDNSVLGVLPEQDMYVVDETPNQEPEQEQNNQDNTNFMGRF